MVSRRFTYNRFPILASSRAHRSNAVGHTNWYVLNVFQILVWFWANRRFCKFGGIRAVQPVFANVEIKVIAI